MIRPPAAHLWTLSIAVVAALAQVGCGGGTEAPATPPVAVSAPSVQPRPKPAQASAPAPTSPPARAIPQYVPPPDARTASHAAAAREAAQSEQASAEEARRKSDEQSAAALKWLQDSEAKKAEYQRSLALASQQVTDAEARVADGEKTLLAFRNPYMPRPKLSEDDAAAVEGKGGAERIQMAQDRLTELRAARDAAQKNLDNLRANPPN